MEGRLCWQNKEKVLRQVLTHITGPAAPNKSKLLMTPLEKEWLHHTFLLVTVQRCQCFNYSVVLQNVDSCSLHLMMLKLNLIYSKSTLTFLSFRTCPVSAFSHAHVYII